MEEMFRNEAKPQIARYFPLKHPRLCRVSSLCLLKEVEVDPFLRELQSKFPENEIGIYPSQGSLLIEFSGLHASPLDEMVAALQSRFSTYFFTSPSHKIAEALHKELIARSKTVALAESCTGGAIAARLTALAGASRYFLGSLVVYSNPFKEHFLQVSRTTLEREGAVSRKTVEAMIKGVFHETSADFAIAVSGIAGPDGGTAQKPVGTICIGIGERGRFIDIGTVQAPTDRASAIEWTVQTSLGALWRRLVHHKQTFS